MSQLKIEGARRQLGTALALYLKNKDPVAVHCLSNGGCELIEFYAKKAGGDPFVSHMMKTFPDLDIAEVRRLQRQYWNAFKHATHPRSEQERDDDDLLRKFSDVQNDHALFIGWYDYALAANMLPIEAQVHQLWYIALYPEKLAPHHSIEPYEKMFPNLKTKPRDAQKRILNDVIATARANPEFMHDDLTDRRPLILGW